MKSEFARSFSRDLRKIRDRSVLRRVKSVIEAYEQLEDLTEARQLKKLQGDKNAYRIRVGDYRIGVLIEGDAIKFVRLLHRRDLYRFFPLSDFSSSQ